MNNIKSFIIIVISFLITSCSVSEKSFSNDWEESEKENEVLNSENNVLKNKIILLELALEDKNEPVILISPTANKSKSKISSQLKDLEKKISNDPALSAKFKSFKKGGVEKYINVSASDMDRIINEASKYLGTKYKMGGLSHSGIDCSGLLYVSFQKNGIKKIPRIAQDFARLGSIIINTDQLKKGDLVFFRNTYNTSKLITHAGLFIGNGEFIHTSSSKGVMINKINDPYYWKDKFFFGTRIIK